MRVDFYLLSVADFENCLSVACRLTEKAYDEGHYVHLNLQAEELVSTLDQALWQFKPERFLPHDRLTAEQQPLSRITFAHQPLKPTHPGILINLSNTLYSHHQAFSRILELVPQGADAYKQDARHRYRHYQKAGYNITTHEL